MTLPDEELDATVYAMIAAALRRSEADLTFPTPGAVFAEHLKNALVAEVRRLRAGSVSEYQQIGSVTGWVNSGTIEVGMTSPDVATWPANGMPVWVRKEDAT